MAIERDGPLYALQCDICGFSTGGFDSFDEAAACKRDYGFHSVREGGEWLDLCEDCWDKRLRQRGQCSASDDFSGITGQHGV